MKFIVLYMCEYPIRFYTNTCGARYSVGRDMDATRFSSPVEAARTAIKHGLDPRQFSIETLEEVSA